VDVKRTQEFKDWIDDLKDVVGRMRILARIRRLADGNPGDHRNLYYTQRGGEVVILQPRMVRSKDAMAMNKKTRLETFDVAEHLRTPHEMAAYLDACIIESDGDAAFIAKALGDIARAQGMSKVARDAGLSRESLYRALSGERSPDFATILKVTRALGVTLHASAA